MTVATAMPQAAPMSRQPVWLRDLGLSFAICLFVYATYALAGFPTLADPAGDNDSMLRLVEIRDLLAGQGWYDLHQYRMGLDGGFLMHWSRLIDAPIAAMILLASALGASAPLAEAIALIVWPFLLMTAALFGLTQLARGLGNESVVFPAVALGAGALYFVGIYRPGSIDHHNAQIALTIAVVAMLVHAPRRPALGAWAGVATAVMLAIAMEAAPYVAMAGASVAVCFLVGGAREARITALFGASFAATTVGVFLLTVGPGQWGVAACDALSNVQLALAAIGGAGIAAIALMPLTNATPVRRAAALVVLGLAAVAALRLGFPQCLADPYASVDPRLKEIWLNYVAEAQSVVKLAAVDWTKLLAYYLTPALALVVLAVVMLREGATRGLLVYGGFLLAAFLVSCWQVRGSSFAVPLATTALAIGIGMLRERAAAGGAMRSLALVAAWLASFNIVWSAAANAMSTRVAEVAQMEGSDVPCAAVGNFGALAGLAPGTVLAVSDLGSPILLNTRHRALAGPYHRNIPGNLAMIDTMFAPAGEAEALARKARVDYVVFCRGSVENRNFENMAPSGLMADLVADRIPAWLEKVPETDGAAIRIYRVRGD